jgi:hypothetical protein
MEYMFFQATWRTKNVMEYNTYTFQMIFFVYNKL